MEVALRAQNLAVAHALVSPWRSPASAHASFMALSAYVDHVAAHLEDSGRVPNNHLLGAQAATATVGLLWPGAFPGPARRACAALDVQLEQQVHADGWSFEGSTAYHSLALELLLVSWTLRLQLGHDGHLPRRIHRMFRVVRDLMDGAGRIPQAGDTDSGRSLVLRARGATEAAYLLPVGAAPCGDAGLKWPGDCPSEELTWLLGEAGRVHFERLAPRGVARCRRADGAGLHVLRAGEAVLLLSAGGTCSAAWAATTTTTSWACRSTWGARCSWQTRGAAATRGAAPCGTTSARSAPTRCRWWTDASRRRSRVPLRWGAPRRATWSCWRARRGAPWCWC